jgi:hypothetical protein
MHNYHPDLGNLSSIHAPSAVRLLIMSIIVLALSVSVILGVLLTLDSVTSIFTGNKENAFGKVTGPFVCLSVSTLVLVIFGNFLISDFRKWSSTRTVRLTIYEKGFTYDSKGKRETCHWGAVKDITHRFVEVHSKHSAPRRVSVINSVIKSDGEIISLAETLDLMSITKLINTARSGYSKRTGT